MNDYDSESVISVDLTETEPEGWMYETGTRKPFSEYTQEEASALARTAEFKLFDLYMQRLQEAGYNKEAVTGLGDEVVEINLENAAETADELKSLLES